MAQGSCAVVHSTLKPSNDQVGQDTPPGPFYYAITYPQQRAVSHEEQYAPH